MFRFTVAIGIKRVEGNCMIISAHFLSTRESWVLGIMVPVEVVTSSLSLSLSCLYLFDPGDLPE